MRSTTILSSILLVGLGSASLLTHPKHSCLSNSTASQCRQKYFHAVCEPFHPNGEVDYSAPCNTYARLIAECQYGTQNVSLNSTIQDANVFSPPPGLEPQSHKSQRLCFCGSQYWNALNGCRKCYKAHGAEHALDPGYLHGFESTYCDVDLVGKPEPYASYFPHPLVTSTAFSHSGKGKRKTAAFSDPLKGRTEVELYFTPAVTNTKKALDIAGLSIGARETTARLSSHLIVSATTAGDLKPTPSSSSAGGAARKTGGAVVGAIGLVGLAVVI